MTTFSFRFLLFCTLLACSIGVHAQIGGIGVNKSFNLATDARIVGLGGLLVGYADDGLAQAFANPALARREHHNSIVLSNLSLPGGVSNNTLGYAFNPDSTAFTYFGALQYTNYGSTTSTDAAGNPIGTVGASDLHLSVGSSLTQDRWNFGVAMRYSLGQIANYNSHAFSADIGVYYTDTTSGISFGGLIRNAGVQISSYKGNNREPMPVEILAGISFKPKHMPVRFHVQTHNLQRWDLSYINTNATPVIDFGTGLPIVESVSFTDKLARHFIAGAEVIFSKNFQIRAGYNHQMRRENSLTTYGGFTGFSLGLSLRIKKLNFSYAYSAYSPAGGINAISLGLNLRDFKRKPSAL